VDFRSSANNQYWQLELSFSNCNVKNENYATEFYFNSGIIAKNLSSALQRSKTLR